MSPFDPERVHGEIRRAERRAAWRAVVVFLAVAAGALLSVILRRVSDELTPFAIGCYGLAGALGGLLFGLGLMYVGRQPAGRREFALIALLGFWIGSIGLAFAFRTNAGVSDARHRWQVAQKTVEASKNRLNDVIDREYGYEAFDRATAQVKRAEKVERDALAALRAAEMPRSPTFTTMVLVVAVVAMVLGVVGDISLRQAMGRVPTEIATSDQPQQSEIRGLELFDREPEKHAATGSLCDASHDSPLLEIVACPACRMRVIPKDDGHCPSCQYAGPWRPIRSLRGEPH